MHTRMLLAVAVSTVLAANVAAYLSKEVVVPVEATPKPVAAQAKPTPKPALRPSAYTAGSSQVVCGRGWPTMCMRPLLPGVDLNVTGPSPRALVTDEDRALCRDYYRHFMRTGQADLQVDWHCHERWLRPEMVPDTSR